MAQPLPPLPTITPLHPLITRILGGNPGKFTLQGTNTYLIGQGRRRLLIDSGAGEHSWRAALATTLQTQQQQPQPDEHATTISDLLLTHWHADHVGGVRDVQALSPGVRVWKCAAVAAGVEGEDRWSEIRDGVVWEVPIEGGRGEGEGEGRGEGKVRLRAVHCPGHTQDHMAFVLEGVTGEGRAVFAGDNVLGHGTAVFEDLAAYLRSLELMKGVFEGRLYPGHGEVVKEGRAKIEEYIAHRREREEGIWAVIKGAREEGREEGWSAMDIVRVVYREYPESLHVPAEGGVRQVLAKMEDEGRVSRAGEGRWMASEKSAL